MGSGMTMLGEENSGNGESGQKNLRERHEIIVAHHHRCFPVNFTRLPESANINTTLYAIASSQWQGAFATNCMPSKCANHVFSWHKRGRDEAHRPAPAVGLCSHAGLTASVIALGISRLTKARESGIQKGRLWWEREGGRKESVR